MVVDRGAGAGKVIGDLVDCFVAPGTKETTNDGGLRHHGDVHAFWHGPRMLPQILVSCSDPCSETMGETSDQYGRALSADRWPIESSLIIQE